MIQRVFGAYQTTTCLSELTRNGPGTKKAAFIASSKLGRSWSGLISGQIALGFDRTNLGSVSQF